MYRVFAFLILFGFWILFSGKFDLFHLTLGVISCLIITLWSKDLVFRNRKKGLWTDLVKVPKFIIYCFWLLIQIVKANLNVIYLALHPRMIQLLSPQIIRFKTTLKSELARVVLANSITLTPGTITVRIDGDEFIVHALTGRIAEGTPGEMERRIANVFAGKN